MCEAQYWRSMHSMLCLVCFFLCVCFDVHLHGVGAASVVIHTVQNASDGNLPDTYDEMNIANLSKIHLSEVFSKYANRKGQLTEVGLEHLLSALGLAAHMDHGISAHRSKNNLMKWEHEDHNHTEHKHDHVHGPHDHHDHHHTTNATLRRVRRQIMAPTGFATNSCISARNMLNLFEGSPSSLSQDQFSRLCPTFLYELDSGACREFAEKGHDHHPRPSNDWRLNPSLALKVWGASFGSVILISLVGLGVVAVIPLMHKSFYNILTQFLIALAVGSLAGDALLHLIPHALIPHTHSDNGGHDHDHEEHLKSKALQTSAVWKSVIAMVGIHLFFFTERVTILCQNFTSKRKAKRKHKRPTPALKSPVNSSNRHSHQDGDTDNELEPVHWGKGKQMSHTDDESDTEKVASGGKTSQLTIGAKLCNQPMTSHNNTECPDSMDFDLCATTAPLSTSNIPLAVNGTHFPCGSGDENGDVGSVKADAEHSRALLAVIEDGAVHTENEETEEHESSESEFSDEMEIEPKVDVSDETTSPGAEEGAVGAGGAMVPRSRPHPHQNKPHGHHHGHSHDLSSVKAIAYTIIAGDGLHNFCDGIAIGAAFANDLRGGLSTTIAVFCHELPHELGDFAVLLHAGMSVKTAIFYNLLSSILCCAGMVIGVLVGRIESAASWVFMLTAGMFLYIALVDMMPELSTSRLKGSVRCHRPTVLFWYQNLGIILGSVIMLIIALYEDRMV